MIPKFITSPSPNIYLTSRNWLVLDMETSNIDKGNPVLPENHLIHTSIYHSKKGWIRIEGNELELSKHLDVFYDVDFIVAQGAKFELGWLIRAGADIEKLLIYDTLLGDYCRAGNRKFKLDLDSIAKRYGVRTKESYVSFLIKNGVCPSIIPYHMLANYCDVDVEVTLEVFLKQRELLKERGLLNVLYTKCLLTPVLADLESKGMFLDKQLVTSLHTQFVREHQEIITKLNKITGGINMASGPQKAHFIYEDLKFKELKNRQKKYIRNKPSKQFPDGAPKTDMDTLKLLKITTKKQQAFMDLVGNESKLRKKISTYTSLYTKACEEEDGHIHGRFNQTITTTHRLSSCLPDYVNVKTDKGQVQLKNIQIGMKVLTHKNRYCKVLNKWFVGDSKVYRIILNNGEQIDCTSNHRLLTNNGWCSLEDIYGEDYECRNKKRPENNKEGTECLFSRRQTNNGANRKHMWSWLFSRKLYYKKEIIRKRIHLREKLKIFQKQVGRKKSNARKVWESTPQLQGSYFGWKGVFNSIKAFLVQRTSEQAHISPSHSNVQSLRNQTYTGGISNSSYKWSEDRQQDRKSSPSVCVWSQAHTQVFSSIRKIKYVGVLPVYDLEIERDECFLANNIYVHNSKPNLQNQDRSLKKVFTCRDSSWSFYNGDFSQLEYRVAGFLAQCPVVKKAIEIGEDPHYLSASMLFGDKFTSLDKEDEEYKELRNKSKPDTFKPLYGGSRGTPKQEVYYKAFIDKHIGVKAWHEDLCQEALEHQKVVMPTGLIFYYPNTEYTASGYIKNQTTIKNYPVQYFATGEIAIIGTILLWHKMKAENMQSFLVNVVHDSVIAEVHPKEKEKLRNFSDEQLSKGVYKYLKQVYNISFNYKLDVDHEFTTNWSYNRR